MYHRFVKVQWHFCSALALVGGLCLCLWLGLLDTTHALANDPVFLPEAPGSISGVVRDANDSPLPGIEVSIYQTNGWAIRLLRTDANGAYKGDVLATGIYRVGFRDPQGTYATEYYENAVNFASATDVPVAGQDITGINAQLAPAGGITGTVRVTGALSTTACSLCGDLRVLHKSKGKWQIVTTTIINVPVDLYRVTALPEGIYRVCVTLYDEHFSALRKGQCFDDIASSVDNAQDVSVVVGQITPNINFVLGDDSDLATLGGQVTSSTGSPLPQITVYVEQLTDDGGTEMSYTVLTDSLGFYRVAGLSPGEYRVNFTDMHGPYLAQYYDNVDAPAFANRITLGRKEQRLDINASLALGGQITGTVTLLNQAHDSNASVIFVPIPAKAHNFPFGPNFFTAVVDPHTGVYHSAGLPPGEYYVYVFVSIAPNTNFSGYYGGADADHATKLVLSVGEIKPNINIDVGNARVFDGSITGQVTAQGVPQAGIQVDLFRISDTTVSFYYTYTDATGHYTINGLFDGDYFLSFSDSTGNYATTYYPNQPGLPTDQPLQIINSHPITNANVALRRGGSISGHVATPNGKPLADVQIDIYDSNQMFNSNIRTQTTDANGDYKMQGLWPSSYRVCFTYDGEGRCYSSIATYTPLLTATDIPVAVGMETKGVDMVFGSAGPGRLYLPQITN